MGNCSLFTQLEVALQHSAADETEVILTTRQHGLTRLANGGIHQNVETVNTEARVRVVLGQRVGVATSNAVDDAGLRALVDRAIAIARVSAPNSEFRGLPRPTASPTGDALPPVPEACTPEQRAETAGDMVRMAQAHGVTAAGHISTTSGALAVGNSHGIRAYHPFTEAGLMAIMTDGAASGYAAWEGRQLAAAPVAEIAGRASATCRANVAPDTAEPGAYTVILEPFAVAEMLAMLAYIGLGATPYQEGRSFMSEKIGERLAGENITLLDDTYHPEMVSLPFDFEGVTRQTIPFFAQGIARGVVYDSYTAGKEQRASTGHALPAPNSSGPLPMHLVLAPGAHSREALIDGVDDGILITRFHYVNIVHPTETILTGMTRDGTFRIKHGKITRPVQNLRFTQSVLDTLQRVTALENRLTLVKDGIYCLIPALRVEGFNFTS